MSTAELVKERLGIAEVVGSYIKLEKAGANLKARCPFHNEKTPSFMVSPSRGSFYCFGCGEKGDIFSFVEKFEGVDFVGALKILADKAGVPIVYEKQSAEEKDEKERLYRALEAAASYFEKNLTDNPDAKKYLRERGLDEKTIALFRLGYAKNEWRELKKQLQAEGYKEVELEKAGLIKKPDDAPGKESYDRFRGRIIFPICDSAGRVVAFTGRIFDKPAGTKEEPAKYLNSPETPLFSKSKILYGYDIAKEGIRKWGFAILVEGQMDLLMSHQSGFRNTVALSGTALTPEHVILLTRLSDKLVLALDSDAAGLSASGKSAALALSRGMDVKVAQLKEGKDPADLVKADPELWKKAVREAAHIIDFYLTVLTTKISDKRKLIHAVAEQVLPYIAAIESPTDRDHFVRNVALKTHQDGSIITEEVARLHKKMKEEGLSAAVSAQNSKPFDFDIVFDTLIGVLLAETNLKKGKLKNKDIEGRIEEIVGSGVLREYKKNATVRSDILFKGEQLYGESPALDNEIENLLTRLQLGKLKEDLQNITQELRTREQEKNTIQAEELLKKFQMLSQKIKDLDHNLQK